LQTARARQDDRKLGVGPRFRRDLDRSGVLFDDDVMAERQAEPSAFSGRLGREKRIEDLGLQVIGYAESVVADGDLNPVAEVPGRGHNCRLVSLRAILCEIAGWETDQETARLRALALAREALGIDYDDPIVLARCGHILTLLGGMHAEGATLRDRAIAANPNCAEAYVWVSVWNGVFATALTRADMSERLDPLSLESLNRLNVLAAANFSHATWTRR
jgi:hypothetical protein